MKKRLSKMERKKIEQRAERVLIAFNYTDGVDVYVDAVQLARFFGFSVLESKDLPGSEDGCISVNEEEKEKYIIVNNDRSIEAKRFIIVHELAHYLLHYTGGKMFEHRENIKGKNTEENDADFLAACLLMPKKSFRKYYLDLRMKYSSARTISELQNRFLAPKESVVRRIKEVF